MDRRKSVVALLAIVILTVLGCTRTQLTGKPAPEFSLTTLDGNKLKLGDFKGRPVILYFFASW